ncbi:MAG: hypothetical protein HY703_07060, partial [Gemmatimonadetes bacterium]|nr:hypothetical protein [Gemmatimonadota bacterium]
MLGALGAAGVGFLAGRGSRRQATAGYHPAVAGGPLLIAHRGGAGLAP